MFGSALQNLSLHYFLICGAATALLGVAIAGCAGSLALSKNKGLWVSASTVLALFTVGIVTSPLIFMTSHQLRATWAHSPTTPVGQYEWTLIIDVARWLLMGFLGVSAWSALNAPQQCPVLWSRNSIDTPHPRAWKILAASAILATVWPITVIVASMLTGGVAAPDLGARIAHDPPSYLTLVACFGAVYAATAAFPLTVVAIVVRRLTRTVHGAG